MYRIERAIRTSISGGNHSADGAKPNAAAINVIECATVKDVTIAPEGRKLLRLEARNAETPIEKKPEWIKTRAKTGPEYTELKKLVKSEGLHTVCQEAGCPNIYECWSDGTATFMVLGERCTRAPQVCIIERRYGFWSYEARTMKTSHSRPNRAQAKESAEASDRSPSPGGCGGRTASRRSRRAWRGHHRAAHAQRARHDHRSG